MSEGRGQRTARDSAVKAMLRSRATQVADAIAGERLNKEQWRKACSTEYTRLSRGKNWGTAELGEIKRDN